MKSLKLKEVLKNEGDKIKLQVIGKRDPVEKTFNGVTKTFIPLEVLINGESFLWETSEEQRNKIKESNCNATFWIIAYKAKTGYIGFNYIPEGDVTLNYIKTQPIDASKAMDETQERILRGMCFNNACTLIGRYDGEEITATQVEVLSKELYSYMKDWLTGKEEKTEPIKNEEPTSGLPF